MNFKFLFQLITKQISFEPSSFQFTAATFAPLIAAPTALNIVLIPAVRGNNVRQNVSKMWLSSVLLDVSLPSRQEVAIKWTFPCFFLMKKNLPIKKRPPAARRQASVPDNITFTEVFIFISTNTSSCILNHVLLQTKRLFGFWLISN